jgi:hypothetical protein
MLTSRSKATLLGQRGLPQTVSHLSVYVFAVAFRRAFPHIHDSQTTPNDLLKHVSHWHNSNSNFKTKIASQTLRDPLKFEVFVEIWVYFQVNIISSFSLVPAIQMHHSGLNLNLGRDSDIASRRRSGRCSAVACGRCPGLLAGFASVPRGAAGGCWMLAARGPSARQLGQLGCANAGCSWRWSARACGPLCSAWPGSGLPPSRGWPSSTTVCRHRHCHRVLCQ